MNRVALYVGANTHFNVTRTVTNYGWMLTEETQLDLITTSPEAYEPAASTHYTIYGDQFPENWLGHVSSLWTYLREESADIFLPLTRPVLYGLLGVPQTAIGDVEYVYRHSGEIFQYYKNLSGWKKIACYGARNVAGTIPLKTADSYLALSQLGKDRLVEKGVDPDQIAILPPTIAPGRFENAAEDTVTESLIDIDRDVVLFIGRKTKIKGINIMEQSIPALLDRGQDFQFVFVGEGGRSPRVPDEYDDYVTVVGGVVPSRVPAYLDVADVLVLPSRTEGVPRVLLEALYMGTRVIASPVGGIPAITSNTYNSLSEFINMIAGYENLPVDSIDQYLRSSAQQSYLEFFSNY